jgi:hypothetical protein
VILFVAATLLAVPLLATHPSPRLSPRMAFDENSGVGILFGGRGLTDPATALEHATDETWLWERNQWVQVFPANVPPPRSAHTMVYDSTSDRILLFGGRKEATVVRQRFGLHGDTWAWVNGNWQELAPANAPSARYFTSMAYDRDRGRVVLFGGFNYMADGKTIQSLSDTWEFDGTDWTRVAETGPAALKPVLVYDQARQETILLGTNAESATVMYAWNPESSSWDARTPSTLPPCMNEAEVVYQVHNQRLLVAGGLCSDSGFRDELYEWDGSNWSHIEMPDSDKAIRGIDSAMAYDTRAKLTVRFGGHNVLTPTPDSLTYTYRNGYWRRIASAGNPSPRSMPLFRQDAERNRIWMFGGLSEESYGDTIDYLADLWAYRDGQWTLYRPSDLTKYPAACVTPIGAMDTDRGVFIVICDGNEVYEWDGTEWETFTNLSTEPSGRRFASGAYDQTQKKFVLFGGYDTVGNYRQDTWTWNGTAWTEVKPKDKPEHRAQATMWYDPLAKKTILYSGAGARSIDHHAKRFSDMWSFDGTNWTRITEEANAGIRFAPQVAVDPESGKVLVFGGLRATIDEEDRVTQFYDNDLWIWDGAASSWTEVQTETAPPARQNGAFAFDPASGKFVLFAGFAGNFYKSDRWLWDGESWVPDPDEPSFRRRSSRN